MTATPAGIRVPADLAELTQWVVWKRELSNGKLTKVPYQTNGRLAKNNDFHTWTTLDAAIDTFQRAAGRYDGIGFVFSESDPFAGIDLDDCLENGVLKPWAVPIVETFRDSYHEISPSGNGIKIWVRGQLAGKGKKVYYEDGAVEVYDRTRYFAFTGNCNGSPLEMVDHQQDVTDLYARLCAIEAKEKKAKTQANGKSNGAKVDLNGTDKITAGNRWESLRSAAAQYRHQGMDRDEIYQALVVVNTERCDPPYDDDGKLQKLADFAASLPPGRPKHATRICANGRQLRDMTADSLDALLAANDPPELYARSGGMVAIAHNEAGGKFISSVGDHALRGRLARCADYFFVNAKKEESAALPPFEVVKDILSLPPGEWRLPVLHGLTEIPVIRPDGTILDVPGYDARTRLCYAPDPDLRIPPIPSFPSAGDVARARALIEEDVLGDFPLTGQASRANMFGWFLTPVVRTAYDGCVPLAVIDAPQAGSGKTFLADIVALTATGRLGAMFAAPKDDDEWGKKITTILLAGSAVAVFDNVVRPIESGDLCRALSATQWGDRHMATHKNILVPVNTTFIATGNNIQLRGDMVRRGIRVRLDAQDANPCLRTGFRHPDLKQWVADHRGEILGALLTLARAWYAAGCPAPSMKPIGGFEKWTVTVGGILEFAGVDGFVSNYVDDLDESDPESAEWQALLEVLAREFDTEPFTSSDVVTACSATTWDADARQAVPSARADALRSAFPEDLARFLDKPKDKGAFARFLGCSFRAKQDRRFGSGIHLTKALKLRGHQQWRISGASHA